MDNGDQLIVSTDAGFELVIDSYDQKNLARSHGAIFVCNQVFPGLDERILLAIMKSLSADSKCIQPYAKLFHRDIQPYLISPDQQRVRFASKDYLVKIKEAHANSTFLGVSIPFSELSSFQFGNLSYKYQIASILKDLELPVMPLHLVPTEPILLSRLQKATPKFLTGRKGEKPIRIRVRVGAVLQPEDFADFQKLRLWTNYLQARIFSLGSSLEITKEQMRKQLSEQRLPVAEAIDTQIIASELMGLPIDQILCQRGQFDVFYAEHGQIPNTMLEIGRLRELTFRAVDEGTGQSRDIDQYDLYYKQLIIWDRNAKRIVGGYRIGQCDEILERAGINGIYTHSLFKMKKPFHKILQKSIELGRSYVVAEYQKHRLPLFLLWKGILFFIEHYPKYRYIIGPVSISKQYSTDAKSLMVDFLKKFYSERQGKDWLTARKPFKVKRHKKRLELLTESMHGDLDQLANTVEGIDPRHLPIPILLKQYIRQNAKFLAFNIDPLFSDCIDGFMMVDIKNLPEETIEMLRQERQ